MENKVECRFEELPNLGVVVAPMPSNLLQTLKDRIFKMATDEFKNEQDVRDRLFGHVDREYSLADLIPHIEPFVLELVKQ